MKIQFAALAAALACLAGCVTPLTPAQQAPALTYQAPQRTLVAVIDDRVRTHEGRPENLAGFARSMGIPNHWTVETLMVGAPNRPDRDKTMAQLLSSRIVLGMNSSGGNSAETVLTAPASDDAARQLLREQNAENLMTIVLRDWHFDVNVNWVGRFRFDSNAELIVQRADGTVLRKQFEESQAIQAEGDNSWLNMILAAYQAKLNQYLNDADVRAALTAPAIPVSAATAAALTN